MGFVRWFIPPSFLIWWLATVANCHDVPFTEKFFDQTLDHFNFYSAQYGMDTYKQRYLVQEQWWKRNGDAPIFFYCGNEADIEEFWANTGFMFDIAPKFNALIVFAEHRFYGKSLPAGVTKSFEHPLIDLLTFEQALADFAHLIVSLKAELGADTSPVVAFGGSYGGMLSASLRIRYPNVVVGSLAASAPMLLVSREVPRDFFFKDASSDFENAVEGCGDRFREAFKEMNGLAEEGSTGLAEISSAFKLCGKLQNQSDYQHLLGWIRNSLTYLTMFDYPYPTKFQSLLPAYPVTVSCQNILQESDHIKGLAKAAAFYYGNETCYDIYEEFVSCSDPTGCGTGPTGYAWDYQACTEFIMPAGTNNVTDMFPSLPFTLEMRNDYCQKRWGLKPRMDWVKLNYGLDQIKDSSNIIFSNGNLDPWHNGGILEDISETVIALKVQGGAHHLDLRGSNPADPQSVIDVRNKEVQVISQWIQEYHAAGRN